MRFFDPARRTHSIVAPILAICMACLLCALLVPFIYAYGFIFPQGDDFDESTRAVCLFDFLGGLYEVGREWFSWSGRYTYHFLAVFFGKAAESRFWSGLVCFGVLGSYALAFWWLLAPVLSRRFYSHLHALVFSCAALLALYAAFGCLPVFYLLTDALTSAHQGATALFFLGLIISLWQKVDSTSKNVKSEWWRTLFTGIFAIGVYEHAALAVICISLTAFLLAILFHGLSRHMPGFHGFHLPRPGLKKHSESSLDRHLGKLASPYIKPFLTLFICLLLPLAISFLAPGNFARSMARGVDAATRLAQIKMVGAEWLAAMAAFLESPWIPLLICLMVALRFFIRPEKRRNGKFSLFTTLAAGLCFLVFSISLVFLHALSDVPLTKEPKLVASFGFYAAITFSVLLFHGLSHLSFPEKLPRYFRSLCAAMALCVFMWLVINTPNFRQTGLNAANGNMVLLADKMRLRNLWLRELATSHAIELEPEGLLGEILFPGTRSRKARPELSLAVVEEVSQPVFPVYMKEALAGSCEGWPNLWAAWMYGQGCIMAQPPDPELTISLVREGMGLALEIPDQLRAAGLLRGWRINAKGGDGITFFNSWLVLEWESAPVAFLFVFRPNPPDSFRLAPMAMQEDWLSALSGKSSLLPDWQTGLAGSMLQFRAQAGRFQALPIGGGIEFAASFPPAIFLSIDGQRYFALKRRLETEKM